jgi:outer membrane receptor protein involved in Fe transport
MQSVGWVDFLKLRASVGQLQTDILPGDNIWTYYEQFYTMAGVTYPFYSYGSGFGNTYIAQAKTVNPSREKTMKYNVGLDATLFGGLNLSFDYYIQHRYDSWVSTAGRYTSVFGLTTPYENLGVVDSHGFEVSADYSKQVGHWAFNVGGTLNLNKNTIKEQAEELACIPISCAPDCRSVSCLATRPSVSSSSLTTRTATASSPRPR